MRACKIEFLVLALVFLGCSSNGGSPDAKDSAPNAAADDSSRGFVLPPFEASPPPDVPHCACEGPSSPSPGGPESVSCQASPSYCAECPIPFHEPPLCSTVGLHCDYSGTWCDCTLVDGGTLIWVCNASV
jgi:hypothetical protein